ncbi:MAG: hypothetical protein RLP09_25145 [Sandaracinaceae bacterium]|nr:hypothetical protein [Myxococcales bacterium]
MSERGRNKGKRGEPSAPRVVRRSAKDRKAMPKDLEAFASGDDDALWRRPVRRKLNDPRPVVLIPGVANRDARTVYEARLKRSEAAKGEEDRETLAVELAEAARLRVWRGHSVVGWEVYAENVLGLSPEEAIALRDEGAETVGSVEPASDELVASWVRAEAGLIEACGFGAAVRLVGDAFVITVPSAQASEALASMGRRAAPLVRDQEGAPKTVVDRPKGVPRLSKLVERDMNGDD